MTPFKPQTVHACLTMPLFDHSTFDHVPVRPQMVRAFEESTGAEVPYRITSRRPGDVAICFADPSKVL